MFILCIEAVLLSNFIIFSPLWVPESLMSTTDIFYFIFYFSPWGEVVSTTDERESIVYADIDLEHLETIRKLYWFSFTWNQFLNQFWNRYLNAKTKK